MDRLEKALQKAREMRGRLGSEEGSPYYNKGGSSLGQAPRAVTIGVDRSPQPVGEATTKQVPISEETLEHARLVARQSRSAEADIFRRLRTKVIQTMARENMRSIAITSANHNEGKSTVALNLAMSMALDVKQTVLLVDLDLRNPSIGQRLGFSTEIGLTNYFANGTPVPQCLVKPAFERLVVLPINRPIENSSEILGSPKMAELANELTTRYADRLVIYDMPPLLTQDDTMAFLPHVDGVILVVRDGATPAEDVKHALNALEGTKLIGTVLNNCADTTFNKV